MIEPIRIAFDVDCPQPHAFDVWTSRISTWWPSDHTATGEPDLTIVLERRPGGRIFERTSTGAEHDWGEVTVWEPPSRLGYLWHLRRDREDATEVEIRFIATSEATSRVEIEHRGWERLGANGEPSRDANRGGWATLLPHFVAAATAARSSADAPTLRRSARDDEPVDLEPGPAAAGGVHEPDHVPADARPGADADHLA